MKNNKKLYCTLIINRTMDINWRDYFDQIEFKHENGVTILSVAFDDQAAFHGMLALIRNLNIEIKNIDCRECDN